MACSLSAHGAENMSFAEWYEEFRREAVDNGVSAQTLDIAFAEQQLIPSVITRDRKQPELRKDFQTYIDNAINVLRIRKARKMLADNEELLNAVYKEYGVPPAYLIAFGEWKPISANEKAIIPLSARCRLWRTTRGVPIFSAPN